MMKKNCISAVSGLLAILAVLSTTSLWAAESYDRQKLIEENSTCLSCHEGQEASLHGTAHQLSSDDELPSPLAVGCIACHDGWEVHIEDPSEENIAPLQEYSRFDQTELCGRCHITSHQAAMMSTDPHNRTEIACLTCHDIHDNLNRALLKDDAQDLCVTCHSTVAAEFKRRSAHPLESGNIGCTDCHFADGNKDKILARGLDWSCQKCHTDQAGPYLHEHPVVYDHLVEGVGCTECHEPHGSVNDRLLNQPGNGTCLQCHGVPPGHRTNHSGLGATLACVDCHTGVHGSYDNKMLLDPDLGMKLFPDCYQSGCHIFNR
jgi:DmsE family decaheme c-type cytochrome